MYIFLSKKRQLNIYSYKKIYNYSQNYNIRSTLSVLFVNKCLKMVLLRIKNEIYYGKFKDKKLDNQHIRKKKIESIF